MRSTSFCEMHRVPAQPTAAPGTRRADICLLDQRLQLGLQSLQRGVRCGLTLQGAVGGVLDGQGDITVLDGLRPRLGGLDRLEQGRRRTGTSSADRDRRTAPRASACRGRLRRCPSGSPASDMNLRKSTAVPLFSAFLAMAKLWPPRLETPGPVMPGSGAASNLPTILESRRSWGQAVHVAPVAVEDQLAVLERLPALLFLPGDGGLRDGAVLEPVDQGRQALGRPPGWRRSACRRRRR